MAPRKPRKAPKPAPSSSPRPEPEASTRALGAPPATTTEDDLTPKWREA